MWLAMKPKSGRKELSMKTEITGRIKEYLKRLGQGEDLELVRADFVKEFESVDAAEIMAAEQQLIEEGTPITEVQRLCDVHAALFHGTNSSENFAVAERKFAASVKEQKLAVAAELVKTKGHPLYTFTRENEELGHRIKACKKAIADGTLSRADVDAIRPVATHYAKKGDLLYPVLKVMHGISGPSDVMWTVDDEIRDEISALLKDEKLGDETWNKRLEAVLKRADDMIYKEANILFPNCALHFTKEEWYGIYRDSKDYAECFGVENARWEEAEQAKREAEEAERKAAEAKKAQEVAAEVEQTEPQSEIGKVIESIERSAFSQAIAREAQAAPTEQAVDPFAPKEEPKQEKKYRVRFFADGTKEQLAQLIAFMNENNIKYGKIAKESK